MKSLPLYIAAAVFFTSLAHAAPGITVANGGQTAICKDPNGRVKSFEAFDLYEGRVVYGYKYPSSTRDPLALALKLADRLDTSQGAIARARSDRDSVTDKVRHVAERMKLTAPGVALEPTGDSKEFRILPEGCGLIPTINFVSHNQIDVSHDAWTELDKVNQAALYLHEAIYWHLRMGGSENDSRRTRKAVAYLMAGKRLEPVDIVDGKAPRRAQFCHGPGTQFLAWRDPKGRLALQFFEIGGYYMLTRTTLTEYADAELPELPIDHSSWTTISAVGQVKSVLDNEMILKLSWARGLVSLTGSLQYKTQINERVFCSEIRL